MKYIVYPYKMGSKSAKMVANSLFTKRVKSNGKYKPKKQHIIINWGNTKIPNWWFLKTERNVKVLNEPNLVKYASNKLLTFQILNESNISIPKWTRDKNIAKEWLENDECKVMCRTILNSHSGRGIIVAKEVEDLVDALLYTKYIKKSHEFRVHVFNGKVIDYVQKKKRRNTEERNPYIRSIENGWVFCRKNIEVFDEIKNLAINAVKALNLDFGAVDIIRGYNGKDYVLEINTAIGLEGSTIDIYKKAFEEFINDY